MMRDLHNTIKASRGMSPVAATTDNTAYVSQINDTNGFGSAEFIGITGVLADADVTTTVLVEDGNDSGLSDAATVDAAFLLGTAAGAAVNFSNDNQTFKIGYVGPKRYWRVTVTPANNTGSFLLAGVFINGHPRKGPQSTQIV